VIAGLAQAHAEDHRGGTLRLLARSAAGTADPQINYTGQFWQIFLMVYDGLVAMKKVPGADGQTVVADLAEAVPDPGDGGRRYVFHLRAGLRFADGQPVSGADVVASFRRMFQVLSPTAGSFYGAILGADACLAAPLACTLPGVAADGATVTVTLTRPDPDFLLKLALPPASIFPAATPPHDTGNAPPPGTGPYVIASYDPATAMRLVRNPYFHAWNPDAQPDGYPDAITYAFGLEDEAETTEVERGQADWLFDTPPADRLAELGTRYASQVHLNPAFALWFLAMNVHQPPFDDIRVRRAVAMAVDRRAAVKLFGGPRLAVPSCQILPPGLPGYAPYCPPGNLSEARQLVAGTGTAGQTVTLITDDSAVMRAIGTYLLSVLGDLGYDARLRALSGNVQFTYIQNSDNHVQISLATWYADYPSPADILPVLFGCAAFHPGSDSSVNLTGYCDPALDAEMQAAGNPADWARIDRAITDAAPVAVLFNPRYIDVTSIRLGHFIYHDQFHWLPSQAWVR